MFINKTLIIKTTDAGLCEIKYFTLNFTPPLVEKLISRGITHSIPTSKQTHWINNEDELKLNKIKLIKNIKKPEVLTTNSILNFIKGLEVKT